jgi:hypothetical protein
MATDPTSFFFADAKPNSPLSYEALQTRRKIAEQLLGKRSPFPKTLGEGLTYLGESLADRARMNELDKLDAERQAGLQGQVGEAGGALTGGSGVPVVPAVPPVRAAPRADAGDTAPATPPVATAAVTPSSEGAIAAATEAVGDPSLALPVDRNALAGALAAQQGFTQPAGSAADQPAPIPQAGTPLPPPRPRIDRTRINAEVQADPTLIPRMATIAKGETGDPRGRKVIAETIANRAIARDQSLSQVMRQYTGPGSDGYYPASTFRNGAMTPEQAQTMQRDVIDPMLRGSDEGTQALGFAPTGNASGGVAARGVASGRYGNSGRLAGETYVTQERPEQLERLAGARLASLGGQPVTAAAAANNAPIVRPDITPLPRVAQAASAQQPSPFGMGTIPGPTARPVPEPAAPSFGRTPSPPVRVFNGPPTLPAQTPMSENERKAILRMQSAPGDPGVQAIWGPVLQAETARRTFLDNRNNEAYKAELTDYQAQQAAARTRPKTDIEQAKAERDFAQQQQQQAEFGGLSQEKVFDLAKASYDQAKPTIGADAAIKSAKQLVNSNPGIFTGTGAEAALNAHRALALLGFTSDPRIAPTQQFKSFMSSTLGSLRPTVIGSGPQSNTELHTLLQAAGSDITLSKDTIGGILNQMEKLNLDAATEHQKKVLIYTGNDNNRRRIGNAISLPMDSILPDSAVAIFKKRYEENPARAVEELDRRFHTPGLAQKLLSSGR